MINCSLDWCDSEVDETDWNDFETLKWHVRFFEIFLHELKDIRRWITELEYKVGPPLGILNSWIQDPTLLSFYLVAPKCCSKVHLQLKREWMIISGYKKL